MFVIVSRNDESRCIQKEGNVHLSSDRSRMYAVPNAIKLSRNAQCNKGLRFAMLREYVCAIL